MGPRVRGDDDVEVVASHSFALSPRDPREF
jgi:hypothetical protein